MGGRCLNGSSGMSARPTCATKWAHDGASLSRHARYPRAAPVSDSGIYLSTWGRKACGLPGRANTQIHIVVLLHGVPELVERAAMTAVGTSLHSFDVKASPSEGKRRALARRSRIWKGFKRSPCGNGSLGGIVANHLDGNLSCLALTRRTSCH